jgi:hypothetical protein
MCMLVSPFIWSHGGCTIGVSASFGERSQFVTSGHQIGVN